MERPTQNHEEKGSPISSTFLFQKNLIELEDVPGWSFVTPGGPQMKK